jgi:hypothetical protein
VKCGVCELINKVIAFRLCCDRQYKGLWENIFVGMYLMKNSVRRSFDKSVPIGTFTVVG